jgi:hypothetical protein
MEDFVQQLTGSFCLRCRENTFVVNDQARKTDFYQSNTGDGARHMPK